jgi:hypothetical protein
MNKPDEVRLSFDQNPALSEATQSMALGDKLKLEMHSTLKDRDAEGIVLTVEAAVPEGYEVDEESEDAGAISPSMTEPNMTPTAMMVKKSQPEA